MSLSNPPKDDLKKSIEDANKVRQVLLNLLGHYQNLEKPMNPGLLKIFIEDSEDQLLEIIKAEVVRELESLVEFRKTETSSTYTVFERIKDRIAQLKKK